MDDQDIISDGIDVNVESEEELDEEEEWKVASSEDTDYSENEDIENYSKKSSMPPPETLTRSNKFSRMTRRQLSLRRSKNGVKDPSDALLNLYPDNNSKKELTEEEILKKGEIARRRKQTAIKQTEEAKKSTVEKLLRKSGSRKKRESFDNSRDLSRSKSKSYVYSFPIFTRYISKIDSTNGYTAKLAFKSKPSYLFLKQSNKKISTQKCHFCKNPRRYLHSKTNLPLCSLECYKKI